jgi:hypothetical protein
MVAIGSAVVCFALSPLLVKWMHVGVYSEDSNSGGSPTPHKEPAAPAPASV